MKCPYCSSSETKVLDKRFTEDLEVNRRRRECISCNKRFTTYERIETHPLLIIKKDGSRQEYDRNKILKSILVSCQKRPISQESIERIVDEIESELLHLDTQEVESKKIGNRVMKKLKTLDDIAYIRFASVYRSFKDIESFERELHKLKVVGETQNTGSDSTDILLQVTTTSEGKISEWNNERIVSALIREIRIPRDEAIEIADAVEKKVFSSGIKTISVSLIRELVDIELFTRGYDKKLEKQGIIGMPHYNLKQLIFNKSNENSNVAANNPEAVNLAIAENTLKQYALKELFSEDISSAHMKGAIHLHDLGYPIRVYCSAHSLEYIKKYGLRLINLSTTSAPAKHAGTLTGHLNTFLASMQAYYAGALGISYVNIFYAPYLVGMSYEKMKQEAQYLIFSCSQNAFSRGGQTLFIDFNIHLGIPGYLKDVPAIGPGGKYTGKVYADYEEEAQQFAKALLDVWREGDGEGKPFPFPKCDLHVDKTTFSDPKQYELLKYACQIASENGSPYFVFDRDEINLSMCCRLRTKIVDDYVIKHPESMRFCGFQNVSINLPQAAYRAGKGNLEGTISELHKAMKLAVKAHIQKKKFIQKLMSVPGAPLWQVGQIAPDGRPYIDLETATYILGIIGLNECVKYIVGQELHESEEAYRTGLKIISAMYLRCKEFEKEYSLKFTLEETPAESASLRLAKIDLKEYPESKDYIRGNKKKGEIYYTNSVHLAPDAPVDIIERIERQSKFNTLIESGAITHVFLGEQKPDMGSVLSLIKKTWDNTQCAQITISPEFTICNDCHKLSRGYAREQKPQTKAIKDMPKKEGAVVA
ncbi:MAG: anaerobic ribonucleoside-triphosphate reductase [archaeon]